MELGLELVKLVKSFGDAHVVRGLDLALAKGEIVALLGPSGCGKTTALRMVAGLESPDAGTISIGGKVVKSDRVDLAPEARSVGMVFQSYAVWPHRSVRDNVAYPLVLKKDGNARTAADEALSLVRLGGMGDRAPSTLSGGQQQRVALARALVAHPSLLLFDEPLSNLDAKLREEMRHEIRELVRRVGLTALYVTHDQPEAFAVSDRVAVVLRGTVAQLAAPAELYTSPVDLEVAKFVGRLSVLSKIERSGEREITIAGKTRVPATFAASAGGASALVAGVRPEHVLVSWTGASDAADGSLPGRVARATFLGERTELVLDTEAGEVRADVLADAGLAKGDTVSLAIAGARVFAAP
ncbi:ABC transporter ATP-binding protein [Myxococcota bacterium]|nr:ABC transporter ATP-binding protein [Myxococcota bacterium]